jgi:hypothetical protein
MGSHVEALIKEKEKENVLTDLELVNPKNASVLNSKELRRRIAKVEKDKLVEENKEYERDL